MRIRRDALIKAIDTIIAQDEKARAQWEKDVERWCREQLVTWKREEWPKFKKLAALIQSRSRSRGPITKGDLKAIFGGGGYNDDSGIGHASFSEAGDPGREITFANGKTVKRPPIISKLDLLAMRSLLEAIAEDTVTDQQLMRLGIKHNVSLVFQQATQLGGMVLGTSS